MNSCDRNAQCTNTKASFSCTCNDGFTGDGHRCYDINECVSGRHKCSANSMCINISGKHFSCFQIAGEIFKAGCF